MKATINAVIHGPAKVGKTWLADTTPAPRLVIDAEGGSRFTPSRKVVWDVDAGGPPEPGDWETCIAPVTTISQLEKVYRTLASGAHPFRSVVLDQLSEIQQRIIAHIVGKAPLQMADWGTLLREMDDLVRRYRDLALSPRQQIEAVVMVVQTTYREDRGKWTPMLSGQMRDRLPYMVDLIGYMYTETSAEGDITRKLLIAPTQNVEAGDRTHILTEHYGPVIENPNFEQMLEVLNARIGHGGDA